MPRTKDQLAAIAAQAQAMIDTGATIHAASKALKVSWCVLSRHLALGPYALSQGQRAVLAQMSTDHRRPITDTELRAVQDSIPPDTRNATQRFMGDPLPGRSWRDQKAGLR